LFGFTALESQISKSHVTLALPSNCGCHASGDDEIRAWFAKNLVKQPLFSADERDDIQPGGDR
jgi:hypothetical protein